MGEEKASLISTTSIILNEGSSINVSTRQSDDLSDAVSYVSRGL